MRISIFIPAIIFILCSSCKTNYDKAENALIEKYSSSVSYSDTEVRPLQAIQEFENELLKRNIIGSISKESYTRLINLLISESETINVEEIGKQNKNIQILSSPLMTASILKSYGNVRDQYSLTDKDHSIVKIADLTSEIEEIGDIGNLRLNNDLINQINDEDFDKIIYRAPILVIIYEIAERNYIKSINAR